VRDYKNIIEVSRHRQGPQMVSGYQGGDWIITPQESVTRGETVRFCFLPVSRHWCTRNIQVSEKSPLTRERSTF
jgi:hypothetical protein